MRKMLALAAILLVGSAPAAPAPRYDTILRGGLVVDGSGGVRFTGDVAIRGDRIGAGAPTVPGHARQEIDARGLAVAPGFVNMLSWADEALIVDPRSESDIRQGVTLEVM